MFVPPRSRKGGSVEKSSLLRIACLVFLFCIATAIASSAQTFTTLATLSGANDGSGPCPPGYTACSEGGLTQGTDGNLYGTTYSGGTGPACTDGCGTVFKLTLAGTATILHSFTGTDGANPTAALILGRDGNFYGTTYAGGANGYGTVFKVTPKGKLTTLYSFCSQGGADCTDGQYPVAALVQASNGNFYGTTGSGGAVNEICNFAGAVGCGTIFEITAGGKLATLYSFCSQTGCADGLYPEAPLVQGIDGNLYGTTRTGDPSIGSAGSIFKVTLAGKLISLYNFSCSGDSCPDGESPVGLVQATDGNFYGTTTTGGTNLSCFIGLGSWFGCGTIFQITPSGTLTSLYSFCSQNNCADGEAPYASLVQGTDRNFYGTTFSGFPGLPSYGTIFQATPTGTLTTLYTFCLQDGCPDGSNPLASLVQATNAIFYGTTSSVCGSVITTPTCGVVTTSGTVFSLSTGLAPFVNSQPAFGKVGAKLIILGNALTGATSVSFGGAAAVFKVVSDTEITATVPNGAPTGPIQVTAPGPGTLSSLQFWVTPQLKSFKPTSGPVGTQATITGVSLTQTTEVTFGGVAATEFTVNSDKMVTATVPTGAATGKITITTPGGIATSAASFKVKE